MTAFEIILIFIGIWALTIVLDSNGKKSSVKNRLTNIHIGNKIHSNQNYITKY